MAEIPRAALDELTRRVNAVSADAQEKIRRVLETVEWTPENVADARSAVSEAARMALDSYTLAAAQAAADFYDASRELCAGGALGARAIPDYDPDATDGAIRAFAQDIVDGRPPESFDRKVLDRVDYEIKRAAARCTEENARRDPLKPRWARVPSGSETCPFCLMLASRGFVYRSEESAGGAGRHWHAHCDCRVVCSWDADTVEGYDPDALYERWLEAAASKAGAGRATYTKPRSDLEPHERAGVDHLLAAGYDIETVPEDPRAPANLDLAIDGEQWEMKNVTNANSSVSNQVKRARIKWMKMGGESKMRLVVTCEGSSDGFESVVERLRAKKRDGERIIAVSSDGHITEI